MCFGCGGSRPDPELGAVSRHWPVQRRVGAVDGKTVKQQDIARLHVRRPKKPVILRQVGLNIDGHRENPGGAGKRNREPQRIVIDGG